MKRWLRVLAPIAVVAIVAAACGDDDDTTSSATTAAGGSATTAAAGGTATTAGGAATPASPGAAGTAKCSGVTIAFFGAQTGSAANLGLNESRAAELAIKDFNAKNKDCQVGYKAYDSEGSPDKAPALAQQIAEDKAVVAVVGPAFSGESKAADPIFDAAGVPIITPSASNPGLAKNNWKIFHRAIANDDFQGPGIASYITGTLKAKTVAIIDDNSEYGQGLAKIVADTVPKSGATVAVTDHIDPKAQDYSATVTKVKSANVDAVMYGGYYAEAGRLAKQLKDGGVTAKFISGDGSADPGFIEAAGPAAAEGAILTAAALYTPDGYKGGADFGTRFKASSGNDTGLYSAEGYDAANFFLAAIAAGKVTRSDINAYVSSQSFDGITKTFKFDSTGELGGDKPIFANVVKGGKLVGQGAIPSS
jgi:branched-chain amino acid transport system substrate-binding protein